MDVALVSFLFTLTNIFMPLNHAYTCGGWVKQHILRMDRTFLVASSYLPSYSLYLTVLPLLRMYSDFLIFFSIKCQLQIGDVNSLV